MIDADGYIGVYRNDYRARVIGDAKQAVYQPRITVRQVDSAAVDLASEVFGGARHVTAPQREGYQPLETWSLHSSAAVRVCEQLGPLLRIKDQQAQCVVKIGAIHAEPGRRRFDVPEVVEGEPLLSLSEAARRAGRSYAVAIQSVRLANIPFVRQGRSIFVPESFVPVWRDRPRSATRRSDITEKLEVLYLQVKNLNRVGAQTPEASPAD